MKLFKRKTSHPEKQKSIIFNKILVLDCKIAKTIAKFTT